MGIVIADGDEKITIAKFIGHQDSNVAEYVALMEALQYAIARKARRLVLQNFALAAIYNFTAIPMAALGFVTPLIAASTMAGSSMLVSAPAPVVARRARPAAASSRLSTPRNATREAE